jgi:VanZ family protein
MRILFSILSIVYITSIFLLAGSSIVSDLSVFNPYSLLHIPLYGVLTLLLVFSIIPFKNNPTNQINQRNHFFVAGFIALIVSIADEIYQAYLPNRNASVTDVLLDMTGISLVLFLIHRLYNKIIPNDNKVCRNQL